MKLERIRLKQFRNYKDQTFVFAPEGTYIIGANGSGKTNLFEAIAYCSLGKSVRYQSDELLLNHSARRFRIESHFHLKSGPCIVDCSYTERRKAISINQIQVKQLSQIFSYVKVVYCSPEDVYLVNGSPKKRRQYFDLAIAQLEPVYISHLKHYLHITEQRNAILKDVANAAQKKHWDELFVQAALPVIVYRIKYIHRLLETLKSAYADLLTEAEIMDISYQPTLNSWLEDSNTRHQELLHKIESKEWQYQRTLIGPHLDDYHIFLNKYLVKDIGSQGQKRSVSLLLKIAQMEMVRQTVGEYPILLLDDIFAELDVEHIDKFRKLLGKHGQVFIASPRPIITSEWDSLPIINLDTAGNLSS